VDVNDKELRVSVGEGRHRVSLTIIRTTHGSGIIAILVGGEVPHVGAVAIAVPSALAHRPEKRTISISTYTLLGHMDDQVAAPLARRLAEKLQEPVVVICGLHVHGATPHDIEKLVENSRAAMDKAIELLT